MKTLPIYLAAAIFAATITQAHAQEADPLDSATKAAATPAPAAATPRPTAQAQAATAQPRAATTTAAPRFTPAPAAAAPRETVKDQLARGRFVSESDLAGMAGQKIPAGVFLVGTYKATGAKPGGRYEFSTAAGTGFLSVRGSTRLLIRYPVAPDPKAINPGNASRWEKAAPLRVERVEKTAAGVTAYATDVTP